VELFSRFLIGLVLMAQAVAPVSAGETTPTPGNVWSLTEAERQALDHVVERAITAGLPDARGGTFVVGAVQYAMRDSRNGEFFTRMCTADGRHHGDTFPEHHERDLGIRSGG